MLPTSTSAVVLVAIFAVCSDACMKVTPGTPGMPATQCKTCAMNLIVTTPAGAGGHAFFSDTPNDDGTCRTRTLLCNGLNANIEINDMDGVIVDGDDGATDNIARITVTCNAAGTAWLYKGVVITKLECASDM